MHIRTHVAGSVPLRWLWAEMLGIAMNTMFIFVVCFGVLVLGVIMPQVYSMRESAEVRSLRRWMRRVRRFQNERENAGWRIRLILTVTLQAMTWTRAALCLSCDGGVLGFIGGLAMATYDKKYESSGLMIAVLSFVVLFGGALLKRVL